MENEPVKTRNNLVPTLAWRRKSGGWALGGTALICIALICFGAGFLVNTRVTRAAQAKAHDGRIFELNIYHTAPGKVPALVSRFRDGWQLQAKHGLHVLGYWVPEGDPAWDNTFIYMVAHSSREEADKNWRAFHADPEFQKYVKAEQAEQLIDKVDTVYMYPADFSEMK